MHIVTETFHKFFKLNYFITIFDFNKKNMITKSNILKIKILINKKSRILMIFDVLFVFNFLFNFFFIKIFEKKNLYIIFDEENYQIIRRDFQKIIIIEINLIIIDFYRLIFVDDIFFNIHANIYYVIVVKIFDNKRDFSNFIVFKIKKINIIFAYRRFNYLFEKYFKFLFKVFTKLKFKNFLFFCEKCVLIK